MTSLALYSPSGLVMKAAPLRRARRRLEALGFEVEIDAGALAKHQRFAGDDAARLDAIHRIAERAPGIAMATRGGYGLSRLLDAIDWKRIATSVERGTRWVGHSDLTVLQLGLLAHTGARSWADLPAQAIKYIRRIEELIRCPVALVSTSPERADTILVRDPFSD